MRKQSMFGGEALFGTVPHMGGEYSVTLACSGSLASACKSGYGEFPREEYPGVPVVRFDLAPFSAALAASNFNRPVRTRDEAAIRLAQYAELGVPIDWPAV